MRFGFAVALLWLAVASGQNRDCSISGRVEDPSAAVFASLLVDATESSGTSHSVRTDGQGVFCFPALPAGTYQIMITPPGFQRWVLTGLEIRAGDPQSLGRIQLAVSDHRHTVSVTASVPSVRPTSSGRDDLITAEELTELPLQGQDILDAAGLMAGITDLSPGRSGPSAGSLEGLNVLGGRSGPSLLVDGVAINDAAAPRIAGGLPSARAVSEVRVVTSAYAAEYGRAGAAISLMTRSGGKQFHGSGDWVHRHESYSANDFFNNRNGIARSVYRGHLANFTVGGPVYIPGRFNTGRNKVFFFFSEDFQRQLISTTTRTVKVPTELERSGNFSQSLDVNGRQFIVYDPAAGQKPFPNQIIPTDRFSSVGRNILELFPLPNFVDPAPARRNQWNYVSSAAGRYPRRAETARLDYNVQRNLTVFSRFSHISDQQNAPYGLWWSTGSVNFPLTQIIAEQPGWGATVHTTATLSSRLVQTFIFGISVGHRRFYPESPEEVSRKNTGIDVPQWNPGLNPAGLLPNMTFGGVQNYANPSMSNGLPYENSNTLFNFVDNLLILRGKHNFKTGFLLERSRRNEVASVLTRGTIAFDRDRNSPLDTNYAYANALLGNFTSYTEATARPEGQFRYTTFELYAQDAWRVLRRLSLDYGVRIHFMQPQYDQRMQMSAFLPGAYDPANVPVLLRPGLNAAKKRAAVDPLTGQTYPEALIGTFAPNSGDPSTGMRLAGTGGVPAGLYSTPSGAAAPRFGFAWDPWGKGRTVVRGGFGMFLDRISAVSALATIANPPTVYTPLVYYGTLAGLAETSGQRMYAPANSIASLSGRNHTPAVYNFNASVQRQIGKPWLVEVSYRGSLSRHLLWQRNINAVPAGANHIDLHPENRDPTATTRPLPRNFLRPFIGYGEIYVYEFGSTTNYHALQATVNRRLSKGVQITGSYTFSKLLGSAASEYSVVSPFFAPRQRNYGSLPWDLNHVFSLRYVWTLPRPGKHTGWRILKWTSDGWELSGIARLSTGAPFTPYFSTVDGQDITGTPSEYPRVDLVNPEAEPAKRFTRPQRGTFGNTGTGILRGNGINNWDTSLMRQVRARERITLQFRAEAYNTFNHTQFLLLQTSARFDLQGNQVDPTFLQPTYARPARRVQFGVRLIW